MNKLKRLLVVFSLILLPTLTLPATTSAQAVSCSNGQVSVQDVKNVCCPAGSKTATDCLFNKYVNPTVNLLSAIAGIAVLISVIAGAIQYSSSAGDPAKVQKAKERIRNALLALVAFFFLYAFLQWLIPGGL